MAGRIGILFEQLRIARVLMMAVVTGTTACGFGAAPGRIGLATAAGGLLSLGCFLLDHLLDRRKDRHAGQSTNPFTVGTLTATAGVALIAVVLAGAAFLAFLLEWASLAAACAVVLIVAGLGVGLLDTPILRAISLGALQGLYALMGGLSALGGPSTSGGGSPIGPSLPGLGLTALFLLFAMTGGRVLGDVRDAESDRAAGTLTIPLRYGVRASVVFLVCLELFAYLTGLAMHFIGGLGRGWLWCAVAIAAAGTGINVFFVLQPNPRRADIANRMSLGLLGGLYSLGMVLSRLVP